MVVQKRKYEAMILIDSSLASTEWDQVMSDINTVFSRSEADVISMRKWDERRLQYEVDGCKRGTYFLAYIQMDPAKVSNMERDIQLSERLLRAMILKADHVTDEQMQEETPAMRMERQDREAGARRTERAREESVDGAPAGTDVVDDIESFDVDVTEIDDVR